MSSITFQAHHQMMFILRYACPHADEILDKGWVTAYFDSGVTARISLKGNNDLNTHAI